MKKSFILSAALSIILLFAAAVPARAISPSYYSPSSALASGRWIKVRVSEAGIQQVSYDALRAIGIDPEKATVWGYNSACLASHRFSLAHPDDLPQVPVYRSGDRLLFYGEADIAVLLRSDRQVRVSRNLGDFYGYYFITDSREALPDVAVETSPSADLDPKTTHTSFRYFEPEEYNILRAGPRFYSKRLTPEGREVAFDLPDWTGSAYMYYDYAGLPVAGVKNAQLSVTTSENIQREMIMVQSLYDRSGSGNSHWRYSLASRPTASSEKTNYITFKRKDATTDASDRVSFTFLPPETSKADFTCLDWVSLCYTRANRLEQASSSLRLDYSGVLAEGQQINIETSRPLRVIDITDPLAVKSLAAGFDESLGATVVSPGGTRSMVAFDPDGVFPEAEIVGETANQDYHGAATPDMLVVVPPGLKSYGERVASLHAEYQGMEVLVADETAVFNEFSSGARSIEAVRRLVKMFCDRDPGKLKYLYFIGPGTYDARGIEMPHSETKTLVFGAENILDAANDATDYLNDGFFAMVDDNFSPDSVWNEKPALSVGRLPIDSPSSLETYLAKTEDYLKNPPLGGTYGDALIMCGAGDENSHLAQAQSLAALITGLDPSVTIKKCYSALFPQQNGESVLLRETISRNFSRGIGYFCFTGHSAYHQIGDSFTNAGQIHAVSYNAPAFGFFASCGTNEFDFRSTSIVTEFLTTENGPMAIVSSARQVYQNLNGLLSEAFAKNYFTASPGDCIGDIYRRAATIRNSSNSLQKNTMSYNLAGDPALPVCVPSRVAALTRIDGNETADVATVAPCKPVSLEGEIRGADGETDASFDGKIFVRVYEIPAVRKSNTTFDPTSVDVDLDETLLAQFTGEVKGGHWTVNAVFPEPARTDASKTNRVALYAVQEGSTLTASGADTASLMVLPTREDDANGQEILFPEITEMYLAAPGNGDGTVVSEGSPFVARVKPGEGGINLSTGIIGASTTLVLDEKKPLAYTTHFLDDGSLEIRYPLSDLADGFHRLHLSVADNYGNRTWRSMGFEVRSEAKASLAVEGLVQRESAEIQLVHDLGFSPSGRLVIEDLFGNTVFTRDDVSFPFSWDLKTTGETPEDIPDGTYRAYAVLQAPGLRLSTTPVTLTVVR